MKEARMTTVVPRNVWILVASFAILGLVACGDEDTGLTSTNDDDRTGITVTGNGQVAMTPDVVMSTLGVTIVSPDLASAQSEAAATMDAVIAALVDNGVAEEDIQTAAYAIYLERDYTRTEQPVTGYQIIHTVTIKIRDVDSAGEVIQAAVDAGANNVQDVWFALEDTSAATVRARELAVDDARFKASELARLADVDLGAVTSISESVSASSPPVYDGREGDDAGGGAVPPINPGQASVYVTVTMTWGID
jgi:hypothetical protein